jgi:hypothetical protein
VETVDAPPLTLKSGDEFEPIVQAHALPKFPKVVNGTVEPEELSKELNKAVLHYEDEEFEKLSSSTANRVRTEVVSPVTGYISTSDSNSGSGSPSENKLKEKRSHEHVTRLILQQFDHES